MRYHHASSQVEEQQAVAQQEQASVKELTQDTPARPYQ